MESSASAARSRTGAESIDEIDTVAHGQARHRACPAVRPGEQLGRYVLGEQLGSGGMGEVFAARDPELNRRVAVKVVHAAAGRGLSVDAARLQLLREGRALAALSHPNVVPIYDVGPLGDGIFVAMELVDGQTLGQWSRERDRDWTEVAAVFTHAARGLAAAHDAGLIHRDFKPANVMIGRDGRIRVMDFGLAVISSPGASTKRDSLGAPASEGETGSASAQRHDGLVMGTPAFMSPEQHCGYDLDDRSDQFSFCVALYRALFGQRPFTQRDGESLLDAISRGDLAVPPADSNVPRRLRAVVARGLALEPGDRWPSMGKLIVELERCRSPRSRNRFGWALAGVAGLGIAAVATAPSDDASTCSDPSRLLEGVWDDGRRAELGAVFDASPAPGAAPASTRMSERLDDYALQWSSSYAKTCAAREAGELSSAQLDLRMTCLGDSLEELDTLIDVYTEQGVELTDVGRSAKAAEMLPAPSGCERDVEGVDPWHPPAPDEQHAAEVEAIRGELRRSRALASAGRFDESRSVATRALGDAEALGKGPAIAEALYRVGNAEMVAGEYEPAVDALQRAYWIAMEQEHAKVATSAASDLVYVLGYHLARPDETDVWVRHAEAALDRWGRGGVQEALFLSNHGSVIEGTDLPLALTKYRRALEIYERETGPESGDVAMLNNNVAATLDELGDFASAREHYERAIEIWTKVVGPDHPDTAIALLGLGVVQARQGEHEAAMKTLNEAERVFSVGLGPDHVHIAMVLISRSNVERHLGDSQAAVASLRRAREIYLERVGPQHPYVAATSINLGQTLSQQGRHEEALAEFREAIRVNRQVRGDEHAHMAGTLANIGSTLLAMDRPAEALEQYEQALSMFEKTLGADHQDLHHALVGIGNTKRALGKAEDAIKPLRRAIRLLSGTGADPRFIVRARLTLAEALQEVDPPQTAEAIAQARTALEEVGEDPTLTPTRSSIEAFLADVD